MEFKGVRTFGQMVKHLSATNHILAAAALGEEPPADAGDEVGPESVRTKIRNTQLPEWFIRAFVQSHRIDRPDEHVGESLAHLAPEKG